MPDPYFILPDRCSIRATRQAEFPGVARGLLRRRRLPLGGYDPPAPLARDGARTFVEAGFTWNYCDRHDAGCWLAGVCLMLFPVESGAGRSAIRVPGTTYDLPLDRGWRATHSYTSQLVNAAPGSFLNAFGYPDQQRGTLGACLVTSHRGRQTEAGR